MRILWPNFKKSDDPKIKKWTGLITVVVQDIRTKEVLMVAFANEEALRKTLATGKATFFTRSRGRLWTKGEESGNFMKVLDVRPDCDGDALLLLVEPLGEGLACHTESYSCFFRRITGEELMHPGKALGPDETLPMVEVEVNPSIYLLAAMPQK